ncbi:hypothetical protein MO973_30400 [Paenibacillus sp. TRM 82003]|nr:hypothetical protein [Paenibacillus sp. TRM 82003]
MTSWNLTVDGHDWLVEQQPDAPGTYHFTWLTGPNPDYGFHPGHIHRVCHHRSRHAAVDRQLPRRHQPRDRLPRLISAAATELAG